MAHPSESPEAVDVPAIDDSIDGAAAALSKLFETEGDVPEDEDELPATEGEEPEGNADDDADEADEPETAIEPPVSLTAEEKARFAQLPPEAQQMLIEVEGRRNQQVQVATTKAAEAQRVAEHRAATAQAEAKAVFAQQLTVFADQMAPQAPSPDIASSDPGRYIAMKAQYDAAKAQHDDFVQQVSALGSEASQEAEKAFRDARDRELLAIPEVQNAETREAFFDKVFDTADALGIDRDTLLENAEGQAFRALSQAHEWHEKAKKYDALQARKMQRVRDSKTATPGVAQPIGSNKARAQSQSRQQLRATGKLDAAAAAIAALG